MPYPDLLVHPVAMLVFHHVVMMMAPVAMMMAAAVGIGRLHAGKQKTQYRKHREHL
jgi:hypothetical protein